MILGDEQPGCLTLHAGGDHYRSRFGEALNARGDIGRVAEDFPAPVDHHRPAVDADPGDKLGATRAGVPAIEFGERALN